MRRFSWAKPGAEFAIIVVGLLVAVAVDDGYADTWLRTAEMTSVTCIREDLLDDQANLIEIVSAVNESAAAIRYLLDSIDTAFTT